MDNRIKQQLSHRQQKQQQQRQRLSKAFKPLSDCFFPYSLFYKISKSGQVYSLHTKRLVKPEVNAKGYLKVSLFAGSRKKYMLHRLVLQTFSPITDLSFEVNHKNYIRHDCRFSNLEWMTHLDNIRHSRWRKRKT